jgi:hypothetical protein
VTSIVVQVGGGWGNLRSFPVDKCVKPYHSYAKEFVLESRPVCKKSKLQLYCSTVRPTVTHGCDVWVLKGTVKHKLMVFEGKVLRRIFGATKERDRRYVENQNKR